MPKVLWQIISRTILISVIAVLGWNGGATLVKEFTKETLNVALVGAKILSNKTLAATLLEMPKEKMNIRDRASVDYYYRNVVAAASDSAKAVNLKNRAIPQIKISLISLWNSGAAQDLTKYNDFLKDLDPYRQANEIFSYSSQSRLALYNLFYYDPSITIDLYKKGVDYEILLQKLGRASGGLRKTVERLNALPNFSDPTVHSFAGEISSLADEAQEISDLSSRDPSAALARLEDFNGKVLDLQKRLLASRQKFWGENKKRLDLLPIIQNSISSARTIRNSLQIEINKL